VTTKPPSDEGPNFPHSTGDTTAELDPTSDSQGVDSEAEKSAPKWSEEPQGALALSADDDMGQELDPVDDGSIDHDDVLAEFDEYDSVESETIGEHAEDRDSAFGQTQVSADISDDDASLTTPKERLASELRLEAKIEAILFASQKPLKTPEILELLHDSDVKEKDVQATLDQLVEFYETRSGGFKLHYLKRLGYQFQTAQEAGYIMERMFASRPRPISRAALETLAIIAYRQPVTRAEVEFIRGVDAGSIFKTLLERELIKCVGRKEIVGRPMMFGTTDEFLKVFNLSSIKDLPPLESFQPSREVVQGAMEKLDQGEDQVDVEEYIAESTAAEYVSDAGGDEWDESVLDPSESALDPQTPRIQGATAIGPVDEDLASVPMDELPESDHGTDPHSEMVIPNGPSVPPRSGDLD
jgi:segregation and condensation protein B